MFHVSDERIQRTTLASHGDNFHILGWVICFDVGVDGFLDKSLVELCSGQLAPYSRVVTALCKLVGPIQIVHIINENLQREQK